ncbi:hypothetical protein SHD_2230 [Shewanella decolorationis S12]|uniref:Uncharacterized protein n=1 Tax=Shewanella decolorationis S12 TaxID=1353536 RepID=A0ABP2Z324_9GAMM|nr:hypothetical protein SHD_2230 [Shewanella decolorationis S12]
MQDCDINQADTKLHYLIKSRQHNNVRRLFYDMFLSKQEKLALRFLG